MDTWSELPCGLVARILCFVPLSDRVGSCALVGKCWAAATVEATNSISLTGCQRFGVLLQWIIAHGERLRELKLLDQPDMSCKMSDMPDKR
jgi:hypothetical protein